MSILFKLYYGVADEEVRNPFGIGQAMGRAAAVYNNMNAPSQNDSSKSFGLLYKCSNCFEDFQINFFFVSAIDQQVRSFNLNQF